MPVYNAERYLVEAIESLLSQSRPDFEILAHDDGSSDRSFAILQAYAERDIRVRVSSDVNRGIVGTLNALLSTARGEYLARMDADDISLPHRFERQVDYLDSHPDCVVVGSYCLFIDPDGRPICEQHFETSHEEIEAAHLSGRGGARICHPSTMLRKSAVLAIGGYENFEFAEDLDLWLRIAVLGKLGNIPEVLLKYRHTMNSVSYAHSSKQVRTARRAINRARAQLGLSPVADDTALPEQPSRISERYLTWAWWALAAGNIGTARRYALKAVISNPLRHQNLKALACALRGY